MTNPPSTAGQRPSIAPVVVFTVLAAGLSWGLWIPTIASQRGWIDATIPVMPWGSFGPAIAAILVAARSRGVRELLRPILRFRARASVDFRRTGHYNRSPINLDRRSR